MNKIFLTLAILIFSFIYASAQENTSPERRKLIRKIDREVNISIVLESLRKCNERIKKSMQNKKPLLPVEYSSLASTVNIWLKYRWLTADTGLSKKWLAEIHDQLVYIAKMKRYVKVTTIDDNNKARVEQAKAYIDISHERLFKLMSKVVKATVEARRQNLKEKEAWQKAMRKKYNIKKEDSWN